MSRSSLTFGRFDSFPRTKHHANATFRLSAVFFFVSIPSGGPDGRDALFLRRGAPSWACGASFFIRLDLFSVWTAPGSSSFGWSAPPKPRPHSLATFAPTFFPPFAKDRIEDLSKICVVRLAARLPADLFFFPNVL